MEHISHFVFLAVLLISVVCGLLGAKRGTNGLIVDFFNWAILHFLYAMLFIPFSLLIFAVMLFSTSKD